MKIGEVNGKASQKLALNAAGNVGEKTSLPGFNLSANVFSVDGEHEGVLIFPHANLDGITSANEVVMCATSNSAKRTTVTSPRNQVKQALVFDSLLGNGFTPEWNDPTIDDVQATITEQTALLWWQARQLTEPATPRISITPEIFDLRSRMVRDWSILDGVVGV